MHNVKFWCIGAMLHFLPGIHAAINLGHDLVFLADSPQQAEDASSTALSSSGVSKGVDEDAIKRESFAVILIVCGATAFVVGVPMLFAVARYYWIRHFRPESLDHYDPCSTGSGNTLNKADSHSAVEEQHPRKSHTDMAPKDKDALHAAERERLTRTHTHTLQSDGSTETTQTTTQTTQTTTETTHTEMAERGGETRRGWQKPDSMVSGEAIPAEDDLEKGIKAPAS